MAYFLAQTIADVDAYLESHQNDRGVIGLDTEYTSLDMKRAKIVGCSISLVPETGLYMPFGHKGGRNIPIPDALARLDEKIERDSLTVSYFQAKGDRTIMWKDCDWGPTGPWRDVAEAAYLADCERKVRDLKTLAKENCGFDMARFAELFTPEERKARHLDLSTKLPKRCASYACADADATLRLDEHYDQVWTQFARAVGVDSKVLDLIVEMEYEGGLELNYDHVAAQLEALDRRVQALEATIYRMIGRKFDVGSTRTLGRILFEEMGITHPLDEKHRKGKSGQWVTNAEVLEALSDQHPVAEHIICFRKCRTALSGPLSKLKYLHEHGIPPRFTLNPYVATTFRLSAPGGNPEEDGKSGCNAQAIGKGESRDLCGVDLSARGSAREYLEALEEDELLVDLSDELGEADAVKLFTDDDAHRELLRSLPYVVETDREDEGKAFTGLACFRDVCSQCKASCESQGIDVTRRLVKSCRVIPSVQRSFRAPAEHTLVSLDYDRQEIVIAANLSGEPVWINALLSDDPLGSDIHAQTAMAAFRHTVEEWLALAAHVMKYERETGKRLNFGTLFGAAITTLARKMGISLSAAEEIWESYRKGLPVLFAWIDRVKADARACGYTQTYLLGRRRPLGRFYKQSRKMQSYADRCAVNTWIQGTGADATRIAMVKIDAACREHQIDRGQCRLGLQIHDELMYLVRTREVEQIIPVLKKAMEFRVKTWQVQLAVSVKTGEIWGKQEKWTQKIPA